MRWKNLIQQIYESSISNERWGQLSRRLKYRKVTIISFYIHTKKITLIWGETRATNYRARHENDQKKKNFFTWAWLCVYSFPVFDTVPATVGSATRSRLRQRQERQRTWTVKGSQLPVAGVTLRLQYHLSFAKKPTHFIVNISDASFIAAFIKHNTGSESTCISALPSFDICSSMGVEPVQAPSFGISSRKSLSWNAPFHCVWEIKPARRSIMLIMYWNVWFFKRSKERLLRNLLHDSRNRDECWHHFSILCVDSPLTRLSSCAKYFVLESMSVGLFWFMYRKSCEHADVSKKLRWQYMWTGATQYEKRQLQRILPLLRGKRLRGKQICQLLICSYICNENWQVQIASIK